ncbi:MAG TPA: long-chain-fatty-acid--CoA ligase [Solirubrobacteraceae bacterium]|nr:long-chain-fatty-acid--CoA ligase [Solirubrobacteraceae bacterium]
MRGGEDLRVADVVRERAAERGDATAIVHGDHELTYAELDERSSRLAQALRAHGVAPGDRVAYLDRSAPEVVELLFAVAKLGAVIVPMNWRLATPELAAVLADSRARLLVAGSSFAAAAAEAIALAGDGTEMIAVGDAYEAWIRGYEPQDPGARGRSDDVVVQMYTSGTTGVPKGVLTTHRNLAAAAETSPRWGFDGESISLTPLPTFHIGGIGWAFVGLWNGASTILVSAFEAAAVLDLLEHRRVTNPVFVPTMLQMLTAVPGAAERDYSSLRSIAYGASPITTTALRAALQTFRCPLFGIYGLTETTGAITQLDPGDHDAEGPRQHLLRSVGRPYPWVELRIADPATGSSLPARATGEVWVRAPNVMTGYFDRPEETAAALTDERWLRTGDGGYLDEDGYLFLTDRIKDMIVSGGENVYPIEIEEVLSRHPAVLEVAVIGVPDERWGEAVTALVVPRPGSDPEPDELVAFARAHLAGYKLPRIVEFVRELPRTPTGKVLKRELRARYIGDPAPAR